MGAMKPISKLWRSLRLSAQRFRGDCSGVAATEFAMVVPIMLVGFFGTVEISSAVAVDRKVTIMARTLSDLASQSTWVNTTATDNFFAAATAIMTPYPAASPAPLQATLSELYVDPNSHAARVQWSVGHSPHAAGATIPIPSDLAVGGTYLIYSEVSYQYTPLGSSGAGYVMKSALTLSDVAFTRPRQSLCVLWSNTGTVPVGAPCPTT
jgi:Flp pilus assembly protein TadG